MRSTIKKSLLIALAGCAAIGITAEAAEGDSRFSFGLEAGIRWDDNIGLTPSDPLDQPRIPNIIKYDDTTTRIAATLNFDLIQSSGSELVLSATPFYEAVSDLDGLSNFGVTIEGVFRGEFGSAFTDPWYALQLGYTTAEFDDSRVRDGDWFEAEVTLGKRFNPTFGISGGFRSFNRSQDNATALCPLRGSGECPAGWFADTVFDLDKTGAFLHADFFVGDKTELFLEYSYWDGDSASTGAFTIKNFEDIVADDSAFGTFQNVAGFARPNRVWRVDAKQSIIEAGISRQLSDSLSLSLTYMHLDTSDVTGENRDTKPSELSDYSNDALELTLTYGSR